jgi:hypothetical protein
MRVPWLIFIFLALVIATGSCAQFNSLQSPSELLSAFCTKAQADGNLVGAIIGTPARSCAAFVLCQQVGMTVGNPTSCQQVGVH